MKASTVAAIWIMASTMCRAGAISKARWDDIDFEKRIWKAAEKSREDDMYEVYLSDFSIRYFHALKADQDALIRRKQILDPDLDLSKYQWIFPAKNPLPAGTPQHINEKAFSKQIYAQQVDVQMKGRVPAVGRLKLRGGKWSAHVLRRTGSTLMAKIGIDDKFRDLCLNHGPKNRLHRIYNQHKYRKQMTRAWRLLGERLETLQKIAEQ
jgi:integrase